MIFELEVPFTQKASESLSPGTFVLAEFEGELHLTIKGVWSNGDENYVVVDGPAAGEIVYSVPTSVLALDEDVVLRLPRRPGKVYSRKKPTKALFLAYSDTDFYFVFKNSDTSCFMNVENGQIEVSLSNVNYASEWELWAKGVDDPRGLIAKISV